MYGLTGIPHLLKEDDMYRGYHIPKGSIVVGNIWGITHDPARYPDPSAFKPERYLAADGSFDCSMNDPSRYAADGAPFSFISLSFS